MSHYQKKSAKTRVKRIKKNGGGALPKLSKERQEELIEQVVAKALNAENEPGYDVIRIVRGKMFKMSSTKARRIG